MQDIDAEASEAEPRLMHEDSDSELMRDVARGDSEALRRMVDTYLPRIHGFASRILRDRVEAEDVVQEALMRAVRRAADWRPGATRFDTWLHTVALNLCRDRLRRCREHVIDRLPERADPAAGPELELLTTERSRSVEIAVHALPERQRDAILLVHYQDLSGAQAAEVLGVSTEALESLLSRGRRSLREQFKNQGPADD